MVAVIWLSALVVLLVIEAATMGLTTIWFAGGALVAFLAALLGAPIWIQAALFVVISLVLLIFTRPAVAERELSRRTLRILPQRAVSRWTAWSGQREQSSRKIRFQEGKR